MIIERFLSDLNREIGFKFGSPWRYNDKSLGVIVPILKIGNIGEREYITLEEAKNEGIKFKDSGLINKVIIESSSQRPIFIRSGTILKSDGTQPRAVESSVVIIPKEERDISNDKKNISKDNKIAPEVVVQEISVRCIYASKGISKGTTFSHGGDVPLEVRSSLLSRSGQGSTWAAVERSTNRLMSYRSSRITSSSTHNFMSTGRISIRDDDLVGTMEDVDKFTENIDEILKKVPLFEDQVGAVFLDMKDVIGIELFDHPKSWEAIHKEVEKRLGESIAKEEEKTFFKPDYEQVKPLAFGFLKKLIDSEKIETSNNKDIYSVTILKGDGVVGEATSINGKVVHLVGMRIDKNNKNVDKENDEATGFRMNHIYRNIGGPIIGSYSRNIRG